MINLNRQVMDVFATGKTAGQVGIEVEAETNRPMFNRDFAEIEKHWKLEKDGSLKKNGVEFVLNKPIFFHQVSPYVGKLLSDIDDQGVKINKSIRAGVHIHLNMQTQTMEELFKLVLCYYIFEPLLTRFSGDGREGNLFCLRAKDAAFQIQKIEDVFEDGVINNLYTNELRYSSLNLQSLFKFGTVEFRSLATVPDLSNIPVWCEIIHKLRDFSFSQKDYWEIVAKLSGEGYENYTKTAFGEDLWEVLNYDGAEVDMVESCRNVQYLAHLMQKGLEKCKDK